MQIKGNLVKDLFIFVFFFLFWFGLFYFTGHLTSGYHLIDDHQIITLDEQLDNDGFFSVAKDYAELDGRFRFRFLFPIHRVMMTKALGTNIALWSVYTGFLGVLTSFFLYLFCVASGFTRLQGVLFSLLTLAGVQAAVWYQSADAENLGMFFLSLTLFFLSKSIYSSGNNRIYKILFAVSLTLMSFSKESFILMIPAILFLYAWLYAGRHNIKFMKAVNENKYLIFFPVILMTILLSYIVVFVGVDKTGQTGVDKSVISLMFVREFIYAIRHHVFFHLIIFGMLITFDYDFFKRKPATKNTNVKSRSELLNVILFSTLIIIPQYFLYYKSGMRDRYFLPFILGLSFFIIYLLRKVFDSERIPRFVKYLYLSVIIFVLIFEIRLNTVTYLKKFADDSISSNLMLSSIISNTHKDSPILAVIDPVTSYEQGRSLQVYLKSAAERNNIYFGFAKKDYITESFSDSSFSRLSEHATKVYLSEYLLDSLSDKSQIYVVAIFPKLEKKFLEDNIEWFNKENFRREEFELYTVYFKK